MLNYIQRHWRGQQSLGWSFWINLVALRIIVFMAQNMVAPADGASYESHRAYVLGGVILCHLLLLVWQLIGVIRSAEGHYAEHGNMALVWGAQLGAVLMLIMSAVYALGAVQMIMPSSDGTDFLKRMNEEHASQYTAQVSDTGEVLAIAGGIELGITRAINTVLENHSAVQSVVLESPGGNIYEARGLARLFAQHRLNTHVVSSCASACTIAFAGGVVRTADPSASFGFHQYKVDADYTIVATDVAEEQKRDQQLFLDSGVSSSFVEVVFSQPSQSMWWPDQAELISAGFVHSLVSMPDTGVTAPR